MRFTAVNNSAGWRLVRDRFTVVNSPQEIRRRVFGHIEGGFGAWQAAGLPVEPVVPKPH